MVFDRSSWSRWAGLAVGLGVLTAAAPLWAKAQEAEDDAMSRLIEATDQSESRPPSALFPGPSLRETGRIGAMPSSAAINVIEPEAPMRTPNEKSIAPAATALAEAATAPRGPTGVIDNRALEREIAERFGTIDDCRVEVARSHQVLPTDVTAVTLLLRWTIERDGTTSATEVVATNAVDIAVMDCAKRVMSRWTFSRPRGGTVSVERAFLFKPMRER